MHDRELVVTAAAVSVNRHGRRDVSAAALKVSGLLHEEQRVKDDGFREGDGQDGLDHDLRGGAGISSDRYRRTLANQPNPDRRAQSREADV
jgi:hypothetical protein